MSRCPRCGKDSLRCRLDIAQENVHNMLINLWGFDDHFIVKLKKPPLENRDWLALYRSNTQFSSKPIFWINPEIDYSDQEMCAGVIEDNILHEYGHVIWELAWARKDEFKTFQYMKNHWNSDEEAFAEDFVSASRGFPSKEMRYVIKRYKRHFFDLPYKDSPIGIYFGEKVSKENSMFWREHI